MSSFLQALKPEYAKAAKALADYSKDVVLIKASRQMGAGRRPVG